MVKAQGDAEAVKTRAEADKFRELTLADGEAEVIRELWSAEAPTVDRARS